jgi:pimeloyl-ACP methyl ester carboxylesterase
MIKRPSLFLYLTEGIRTFFQLVGCLIFMAFYRYNQKGDGHPVLVVPGFLGSDVSTALIRRFLNKLGYKAFPWDLGRNLGDLDDLPQLAQRIKDIYAQEQRKITLIGWSLGGVYVREMAKGNPDVVRQVITLGSPFGDLNAPNHARWIFDLVTKGESFDPEFLAKIPQPAPVRTAALYSKQDGIVPWEACMEKEPDTLRQNIQVRSSHFGFVANKRVFRILVERLKLA